MKQLINFTKNESGAVTVDWVVLTAAIVGIGIAVVAAISNGIQSASNEIYGGLETASAFTFSFDDQAQAGKSGFDYWLEFGGDTGEPDYAAIVAGIEADSPVNYTYSGNIELESDQVIYQSTDGSNTFSIGGEIVDAGTYSEATIILNESGMAGDMV